MKPPGFSFRIHPVHPVHPAILFGQGEAMIASAGTAAVVAGAVLAAGLGMWTAFAFNRLVRDRNLLREGWSGIDVQLKRRHNLVPNLVEAVKGYARHEKTVLEDAAAIRAAAAPGGGVKETEGRENALTDQLKRLFALAESYPELKADRNFRTLMEQLAQIEDALQLARRYYNGAVRNYNIRVQQFPSNAVAAAFGFRQEEFFQLASATDRAAPKVDMQQQ